MTPLAADLPLWATLLPNLLTAAVAVVSIVVVYWTSRQARMAAERQAVAEREFSQEQASAARLFDLRSQTYSKALAPLSEVEEVARKFTYGDPGDADLSEVLRLRRERLAVEPGLLLVATPAAERFWGDVWSGLDLCVSAGTAKRDEAERLRRIRKMADSMTRFIEAVREDLGVVSEDPRLLEKTTTWAPQAGPALGLRLTD